VSRSRSRGKELKGRNRGHPASDCAERRQRVWAVALRRRAGDHSDGGYLAANRPHDRGERARTGARHWSTRRL